MHHIEEHTAELYFLDATQLAGSVRKTVEKHLQVCPACSALFEYIRSFYAEFRDESLSHSREVKNIVDKVAPIRPIFPLRKYGTEEEPHRVRKR